MIKNRSLQYVQISKYGLLIKSTLTSYLNIVISIDTPKYTVF